MWLSCQQTEPLSGPRTGLQLPIAYYANSLLYMDFINGLPRFGGYDSCLVVTCSVSPFTCALPCCKKFGGEKAVKILDQQWFEPYRAPKEVHSE